MVLGSAVTALSCSFYQTLLRAGVPVGAIRTTPRFVYNVQSHIGMLVLRGVVLGAPDGVPHSCV